MKIVKALLIIPGLLVTGWASGQFNRAYQHSLTAAGNLLNEPLVNVITDQQSNIRVVGQIGVAGTPFYSDMSFSLIDNAGAYQSVLLYNNQDSSDYKAQSLAETPEGDFIVVGSGSYTHMTNQTAFAMKVDPSGNVLWVRDFPGFEFRLVSHLESDSLHDYFLMVGTVLDSNSQKRLYCVKIDEDANQQWAFTYSTYFPVSSEDIPNSLAINDTAIALVGTSEVNGDPDLFIAMLDYNGQLTTSMKFLDIDSLPNYNPYVHADTSNVSFYLSYTTASTAGSSQVTYHGLAKFDGNLTPLWAQIYATDHVKYGIANMIRQTSLSPAEFITAGTLYDTDTKRFMPYTFVIDDAGSPLYRTIYPQYPDRISSSFTVNVPQNLFILHTHYESSTNAAFDLILTDNQGKTDCDSSFELEPTAVSFNERYENYFSDSLPHPQDRTIYSYPVDFWDINCDEIRSFKAENNTAGTPLLFHDREVSAAGSNQWVTQLQVYNLAGQLVHQAPLQPGETILLPPLTTGIYIMRYATPTGVEQLRHFIK